ncbi:N-methyl-L-tryptophan oxidase [Actinomycetes bacterium KLBMP 9759]
MDAQVAVVGLGSTGSMALWQLAKRGVRAIGFEQFTPGHDRAAAGGESRIFRTAYLEGPQYVPLLLRARQLWRELEEESGARLLTLTGGLMIGSPGSDMLANITASAERYDLPHEVLDDSAMAARFPQHRLRPGEIGFLDEWAGFLRPEFAVLAAARCAQARGATVVPSCRVDAVEPEDGRVSVHAGGRAYSVEQVIVAPGPWTARFAPQLAEHVRVEQLLLAWYYAPDAGAYAPDRFPIFIRDIGGGRSIYGFPTIDGGLVKVSPEGGVRQMRDADAFDRNVPPSVTERVDGAVAEWLPGLVPTPLRVSTHPEAFTGDGHGLLGRLPGAGNVWLCGAFSGHGFKMSTVFGEVAAQLATAGGTDLPIAHLDPARLL